MKSLICPKCNGKMKEGLKVSVAPNGIQRMRLIWLDGETESGFFGFGTVRSVEGREDDLLDFACEECGFVESYIADRIMDYLEKQ